MLTILRLFVLAIIVLWQGTPAKAQKTGVFISKKGEEGLVFSCNTGRISLLEAANGYLLARAEGLPMHTAESGKPQVPLYRVIVALPAEATPMLKISEGDCDTFFLNGPLLPCPPPRVKDADAPWQPLPDEGTFASIEPFPQTIAALQELGMMNGKRLALITIAPVQYFPAQGLLTARRNLEVSLDFGSGKGLYSKPREESETPAYVIATVDSFVATLQPFVRWKQQEGYDVEVISATAWNRDTLRSALQRRYEKATALHPAPSYVLLAGDIMQIPPCFGTEQQELLGTHLSDFPYGEYTGDMLPDAMVGRMPARNAQELSWMLSKTVSYEKSLLVDTAYLNRTLLVAGNEQRGNTDTITNGQVNYLRQMLADNDATCFYNPASNGQKSEILSAWGNGVGHVNYTAHCLANGWHHPQVFSEDIDTMGLAGRYFFAVNNCCSSNDLSGDSFGKTLMRKGAVGVIGATGETLWDEDYFWAVGCKTPFSLQPAFDSTHQGAYDRMVRREAEPYEEQAHTAGEMLRAGNCAVAEYASPFASYYSEVYCLLGDPSLMPYFKAPKPLQADLADSLKKGDSQIRLVGTPFARIAIMQDSTLLGSCLLDSLGTGLLELRHPVTADTVLLTATAQGFRTEMRRLAVCARNGAWLAAVNAKPKSLVVGSAETFSIQWKNVGDGTACGQAVALLATAGNAQPPFSATIAPTHFVVDSLPPDSIVTCSFQVLLNDSRASHITLLATAAENATSEPYSSQALRTDVRKPKIVLKEARLRKDNKPTNTLLPKTDYWLQLVAENASDCYAATSRLCVTGIEGGVFLANACHAGVAREAHSVDTILLPVRTNDTLSHLLFHAEAYANNDLAAYDLLFLVNDATETFANGNFCHFPWDTTAVLPWTVDGTQGDPRSPSARSATLASGQRSELAITLQANATDTISFYTKILSPSEGGTLSFWMDGARRATWNATHQRTLRKYLVPAGTHAFLWRYESNNANSGHAWIDDVRMPFSCYPQTSAGYGTTLIAHDAGITPTVSDSMVVFPNPTKDKLWIRNAGSLPLAMALLDSQGRTIETFVLPPHGILQHSLANLPRGIYFLRCGGETQKIILF